MRPSRRWLLIAGAAAALSGGGWLGRTSPRARAQDILQRVFGPEIAALQATAEFIDDYLADLSLPNKVKLCLVRMKDWLPLSDDSAAEERIVNAFARSSNAVRAAEIGEAFVYLGLNDPYESPCINPMTSHWL